jgi:hypothetical protein
MHIGGLVIGQASHHLANFINSEWVIELIHCITVRRPRVTQLCTNAVVPGRLSPGQPRWLWLGTHEINKPVSPCIHIIKRACNIPPPQKLLPKVPLIPTEVSGKHP